MSFRSIKYGLVDSLMKWWRLIFFVLFACFSVGCEKNPDDPFQKFNKEVNEKGKSLYDTLRLLIEKKEIKGEKEEESEEEFPFPLPNMTGEDILVSRFFQAIDKVFDNFCGERAACGLKEIERYCAGLASARNIEIRDVRRGRLEVALWLPVDWRYDEERQIISGEDTTIEILDEVAFENIFLPEPNLYLGGRVYRVSAGAGWRGTVIVGEEGKEGEFREMPPVELAIEGAMSFPRGVEVYIKIKTLAANMEKQVYISRLLCLLLSGMRKEDW
ncbi:MAG: hypothetical protein Kow0090_15610 [Myxococcota bacterium]